MTTPIWPSANRTSSRLGRPALEPTARCTAEAAAAAQRIPARTPMSVLEARAIVAIDPSSRTQWPRRRAGRTRCGDAVMIAAPGTARRAAGKRGGGAVRVERLAAFGPPATDRPREEQPGDDAHDHRQHHVPGDRSATTDECADEDDRGPDHRQVGHRLPHALERVRERGEEVAQRVREARVRVGEQRHAEQAETRQSEQDDVGGATCSRLIVGLCEQTESTSQRSASASCRRRRSART